MSDVNVSDDPAILWYLFEDEGLDNIRGVHGNVIIIINDLQ